jgi:translation initiation factor IF-1
VPKIRGIKPEFWTDEDIVELSLPARLLFIGLWNLACDNGHIPDKPKQIKMRILPADDVDVDILLNELAGNGRIERADKTVTVLNFARHQKPHRRWWTTCELPLCEVPEDAPEQGYNRGEGSSDSTSQPLRNRGTTVDHGGTTADVDVEGDGDSELKVRAKRATQLSESWQPNDQHEVIAADREISLDAELAKFRDWAKATGRTYKDWDATFRNWLRNARTNGNVTRLPVQQDNGWDRPEMPAPPPEIADDPERYARWMAEQGQR